VGFKTTRLFYHETAGTEIWEGFLIPIQFHKPYYYNDNNKLHIYSLGAPTQVQNCELWDAPYFTININSFLDCRIKQLKYMNFLPGQLGQVSLPGIYPAV
jgi:hypothetical protein